MSTITYPSAIIPNSSAFQLVDPTQMRRSFLNGTIQVKSFGGPRWQVTLNYINLTSAQEADLVAALSQLLGTGNVIALPVHGHTQRGAFGGTPLVNGSGQIGNALIVDGASNTITDWIKAGDYFQIGTELKRATADADTDGSGNVTLQFTPRLRTSPSDNDAIVTSNPTGLFYIDENGVQWAKRPGVFTDLSATFVEAV